MPAAVPLRRLAAFTVAGLSLLLGACLLSPGKFDSTLDLRKDGHFAFTYTGEISMLGLTKLAEMGRSQDAPFEPSPCFAKGESKPRDCTKAKIDAQRADWDKAQKAKAENTARDAEKTKALFGGIDPTSPKAAEEMAERLRKQSGWKSVIYKGDGLYDVAFAISGRLDHDFTFPTIERFPMANAFVTLIRRSDGTVRVDAPGFGPQSGSGNMSSFAAMAAMEGDKDGKKLPIPEMDGHFAIITDGTILANNTEDGPSADTTGQRLTWAVNARTGAAPTALVKLGQ
ncbi:MAG: hypothetical protein JSR28_05810 [Proteobacteria bacterium]|nr:hypothetical protein [Pseudomonadota bacterium]